MCKCHGCSSSSTSEPLTMRHPQPRHIPRKSLPPLLFPALLLLVPCHNAQTYALAPLPLHSPFWHGISYTGSACQHRHLSRSRWVRGRLERRGCARYTRRPLVELRGVLAKLGAHWWNRGVCWLSSASIGGNGYCRHILRQFVAYTGRKGDGSTQRV